jgi:peroxiredoxin/YHS domain-containing protein
MNVLVRIGLASALVMTGPAVMAWATSGPAKAICRVCQVKHGEAEEEPVKAVRTWQGQEYGFCSEACAKEFDADPAAYAPSEFPREAPAFSLQSLAGEPLSNGSLKGKVVLLDFWATWCAPCRKSMPELQALHKKYAERGFTVIGVSIDEGKDGPSKVKKFVSSKKIAYPIALDSEQAPAWEAFKVKAVPAAFLLDQQGRVVAQWTGVGTPAAEVEEKLATLLRAD